MKKNLKFIGIVNSFTIKNLNHPHFLNDLVNFPVSDFMIPASKLPIITEEQTLAEIIEYFLSKKYADLNYPSSFIITE